MSRFCMYAVLAMLWPVMSRGTDPSAEQAQLVTLRLGDEVLFGRIIYGDTAKFWETHTLIMGTVAESRQEYLPKGEPRCLEHVGIRIDETVPQGRFVDQRLRRVTRERPVIAYDVPAEPPPQLYRVGTRILLLVSAEKEDGKVDFEFKSYAMMPNGSREMLFLEGVDERLLESTKTLCQALSTDNPSQRVAKLGKFLKENVSPREKHVVRHSLQTSIKELESGLEEAKRIQKTLKTE